MADPGIGANPFPTIDIEANTTEEGADIYRKRALARSKRASWTTLNDCELERLTEDALLDLLKK